MTPKHESRIAQAAAEWLMRHDRGLTRQETDAFSAWLQEDARHQPAFERLQRAWGRADVAADRGQAAAIRAGVRGRMRRRRRARMAGLAAALVLGLAGAWMFPEPASDASVPAIAAVLGPERRVLPDGSVAEFPAGTELDFRVEHGLRRVTLRQGEAHFEVKSDPTRPFVVATPRASIRAVGTAFAVEAAEDQTTVVVTHGRVAVSESRHLEETPLRLAVLDAGQGATVHGEHGAGQVASLDTGAMAQRLAWRERRVEFSAAPLSEVLAFVNQHNRVQLVLADPALATVSLSGVFRLNDPDDLAGMLERGFGFSVDRSSPERMVVRSRDAAQPAAR